MSRSTVRTMMLIAAPAVGMCAAHAAAQAPTFDLVGLPNGGVDSYAYALSANGTIAAGYSHVPASLANPGFTWTRAQGRSDFGLGPGVPPSTESSGISGDGSTVVGYSFGGPGTARAFRWQGPGTFQTLGLLSGDLESLATGVSGDGSVVVGRSTNDVFTDHAFRWTAAGGMQPLGFTHFPFYSSVAAAVSRDGSTIVGTCTDPGSGETEAFARRATGGMQTLPQLPGTPFPDSIATAVNFDGSIIVGRSGAQGTATMWRGAQVIDLGSTAPFGGSSARGVSDDGNVVACLLAGGPTAATAGVWTAARGMEPLASYFAFTGVPVPAGWTFPDVRAISGDGMTFAGFARSPSGEQQGFVATVPAPGALPVVMLALVLRGMRVRDC